MTAPFVSRDAYSTSWRGGTLETPPIETRYHNNITPHTPWLLHVLYVSVLLHSSVGCFRTNPHP